jgi:group I intron endonuclease
MGKLFTIYRIYNTVDGKSYIGQTGNFKGRIAAHFSNLEAGINWNDRLQDAYKQYGRERFEFEALEFAPRETIDEREIFWMAHFRDRDGIYNIKKGGSNGHLKRQSVKYEKTAAEIKRLRQEIEGKQSELLQLKRDIARLNRRARKLETRLDTL